MSCTPLDALHQTFLDWFGTEYDLDAVDFVCATVAAERLDGDPLWGLIISGPGNAKTETVSATASVGALITSTITSEGALLSGSPKRETAKDATGGLLRRIGARGVLVVKDVTSILSMNANTRSGVLAALREIYDGRWERNIGTDGGRSLPWIGRLAVIGACTTAWDSHQDVISQMGDRFVILRMDSSVGRLSACYKAMANTGSEEMMRASLAAAVAAVIDAMSERLIQPTVAETGHLAAAADVVARVRTAVDRDYKGEIIDAHAPEMPTRFAKQLVQVFRGASAIGLSRPAALRLALRCARDSMPPLRLAILEDVHANPHTRPGDVRRRLNRPYMTIDRQLQAMHMLRLVTCDEVAHDTNGKSKTSWFYSVDASIDVAAIQPFPEKLVSKVLGREEENDNSPNLVTHFSGNDRFTAGDARFCRGFK